MNTDKGAATMTTTYPALTGDVVTEAHTRTCAERGHARHTVNGEDTGTCPRCGAVVVFGKPQTDR